MPDSHITFWLTKYYARNYASILESARGFLELQTRLGVQNLLPDKFQGRFKKKILTSIILGNLMK